MMESGHMLGLVLLLSINLKVQGEATSDKLFRDVVATVKLPLTTIVYDSVKAPKICHTHRWVLCLRSKIQEAQSKDATAESEKMFIDGRGKELMTGEGGNKDLRNKGTE